MTIATQPTGSDMPESNRDINYSPFFLFTSEEWARFRADTPLTLTADEVQRLRTLHDPIDLNEVRRI